MITQQTHRLAMDYNLTLYVARFFILLIENDYITSQMLYDNMGDVDGRNLVWRLRRGLAAHYPTPPIIHTRRQLGYWLNPQDRLILAKQFHIEFVHDTHVVCKVLKGEVNNEVIFGGAHAGRS